LAAEGDRRCGRCRRPRRAGRRAVAPSRRPAVPQSRRPLSSARALPQYRRSARWWYRRV